MAEPFRKILVCVKHFDSSTTGVLLERAVRISKAHGASLELVSVVEELPPFLTLIGVKEIYNVIAEKSGESLDGRVARAREEGVHAESKVLRGRPPIEVVREVLKGGHDLVLLTRPEDGRKNGFFGSLAGQLARYCPCPVWAMSPETAAPPQRILAAIDPFPGSVEGHELNRDVMRLSFAVRQWSGAELRVAHAWRVYREKELAKGLSPEKLQEVEKIVQQESRAVLHDFVEDFDETVPEGLIRLVKGDPVDVLPTLVEKSEIDLLVMGSVGRTGIPGWFVGNTAEKVLDRVGCSLLTVKPRGFVSPITGVETTDS